MVSSRPLNTEDFIKDDYVMPESVLPPVYELDTIYQFIMGGDSDTSSAVSAVKTIEIV